MKNSMIIKKMCFIAMFATIASVLYVFPKFKLDAMFPGFLEINFSMLPIFIAAFMIGPREALYVVAIRFVINILLEGTTTHYVGEITDVILGACTALGAGLPYKYLNCKNKSIISIGCGIVTWTIAGAVTNWLYCVPQYLDLFFGGNKQAFVGACKIIPGINESNYMSRYIFLACVPFNLLISISVSIVTFIVHKRLEAFYRNVVFSKKKEEEDD